jgi:hypothetical protein
MLLSTTAVTSSNSFNMLKVLKVLGKSRGSEFVAGLELSALLLCCAGLLLPLTVTLVARYAHPSIRCSNAAA